MATSSKWLDTVGGARTDRRWDGYDTAIKAEVVAYNVRFASSPGYTAVDWLLVKAMVWVESGGPDSPAWNARVLQIGNKGDPAYDALRRGAEGTALVAPDDLKA